MLAYFLMIRPTYNKSAAQLVEKPFDLIVIGGGINGTGIARDASRRGLSVLLLEKNDFGAGTTAYSSRLIHGGLRYLEHGEISLVRESLRERERLLHNAPHLVKPLPLGIPVYQDSKRPLWMIRVGMWLYDALSWDRSVPGHQNLSKDEFLLRFPYVESKGLKGGVLYYDAQVSLPERVSVENAIDAKNHGAVMLNHADVESVHLKNQIAETNQDAASVTFKDVLTGETLVARGQSVVNASGPWVDKILGHSNVTTGRKIGGTKGIHIVVPRSAAGGLPQNKSGDKESGALYVEAKDGRPFFMIPWQQEYLLIGTTDTHYDGDLDKVVATPEDVAYLLDAANQFLSQKLSQSDILFSYAGVRPLPFVQNKNAGAITRKHITANHQATRETPVPFFSVIGGKLTTYRSLAEEVVNTVCQALKYRNNQNKYLNTRWAPLPGADVKHSNAAELPVLLESGTETSYADYAKLLYEQTLSPEVSGLTEEQAKHLLNTYGLRAGSVMALTLDDPTLKMPVSPHSVMIQAEVIYAVRHEMAQTIADVLMRRSGLALREGVGLSALETVSRLMAKELQWSEPERLYQVEVYTETVTTLNQPKKN
ncbi:MAG: glycerol-3-phosphate dehydrogenase [Cyanobacteria bacterium]|nr:glycerol-3-phosphate dehydrogenase [Cyanobacteriota bacterium]